MQSVDQLLVVKQGALRFVEQPQYLIFKLLKLLLAVCDLYHQLVFLQERNRRMRRSSSEISGTSICDVESNAVKDDVSLKASLLTEIDKNYQVQKVVIFYHLQFC